MKKDLLHMEAGRGGRAEGPGRIEGPARIDRRTKNLAARLNPGDIAVIVHRDLDEVAADALVQRRVKAVLNCSESISGRFANRGPFRLIEAGIPLVDGLGEAFADSLKEGDRVTVDGGAVRGPGGATAAGTLQTAESLNESCMRARENMEEEIDKFVQNTLRYVTKEKAILTDSLALEHVGVNLFGRQALAVARGKDFRADLKSLRKYIDAKRPYIIAVDGAADAVLSYGWKPDMILGDMDSVSDGALRCGAKLVVHAYPDGRAPGCERLAKAGLDALVVPALGTSEDLALLLAFDRGAELIVLVGSHFSMDEFLSKDRQGMSSTFLTRLKVGSILVDAKGVGKLYEDVVKPIYFVYVAAGALFAMLCLLFVSPLSRQFFRLFSLLFQTKV